MKKLIAALTAASIFSCPAAFAKPDPINVELVFGTYLTSSGETRGFLPCEETAKTFVARVNGEFQCIELTTLYADGFRFDDATKVNELMR